MEKNNHLLLHWLSFKLFLAGFPTKNDEETKKFIFFFGKEYGVPLVLLFW